MCLLTKSLNVVGLTGKEDLDWLLVDVWPAGPNEEAEEEETALLEAAEDEPVDQFVGFDVEPPEEMEAEDLEAAVESPPPPLPPMTHEAESFLSR